MLTIIVLGRNDMPSKAILKISERNIPSFLELFVEEKELCAMCESKYIGELGNFHSVTVAEAWANRYFCGLAAGEAGNNIPAEDNSTILKCCAADFGANTVGISLYIESRQFPVVLDFYSGLGVELFALINDRFDHQLRREC